MRKTSDKNVAIFTDADWAGSITDIMLTSGYKFSGEDVTSLVAVFFVRRGLLKSQQGQNPLTMCIPLWKTWPRQVRMKEAVAMLRNFLETKRWKTDLGPQ